MLIKYGSRGDGVKHVQTLLNDKGFGPIDADGLFGSGTENAVKRFQSSTGLSADGIVGPGTMGALEDQEAQATALQSIKMQDLVALFPQVDQQTYKLVGAQTPVQPNGVRLSSSVVGNETINCTQFTTFLVSQAFKTKWSSDQWARWQNTGRQKKTLDVPNYGPRVALDWGVATTSPGKGPLLIQYFTATGGHSLIVLVHDEKSDKILTLESNSYYGIDGAGWAGIGNLRDVPNPGANWMDKTNQTWESRIQGKLAVHAVRLHIDSNSIQEWLESGDESWKS
tara:strand:+ start:2794 stop:3639 length:846 start_codon:yes stop_codon:yes gene_type:complete